jgi:hypothetical protein
LRRAKLKLNSDWSKTFVLGMIGGEVMDWLQHSASSVVRSQLPGCFGVNDMNREFELQGATVVA